MEEFVYHGKDAKLSDVLSGERNLPYAAIQKLFRKKDIKMNGARVSADRRVREGDRIAVYLPHRDPLEGRVLFSDERVVVLNKPRRLDTYEAAELLSAKYGEIIPVHRLDRNTAGVMIFARDAQAEEALARCFRDGKADKRYRALVAGAVYPDEATLTAYQRKDAEAALVEVRDTPAAGYERIMTGYRVLKRQPDCTELEVRLYTGRTHQIRAHFAHLGHPVIGDGKYGDNAINRKFGKRFQELTCVSLFLSPDAPLGYLADRTFQIDVNKNAPESDGEKDALESDGESNDWGSDGKSNASD